MSIVVGASDGGEMTLAVSLAAAEQLADPGDALAAAREWSQHVGVVGNDADAVDEFVAEHDVPQDFALGDRDKWLLAERIREETHTPRHVYVGTSVEDRRIAEYTGWEFQDVRGAAEKADWDLGAAADGDAGLVARLRGLLTGE